MIRMVVCDVDGTLLPKGSERLDDSIIGMIKKLTAKGVLFAAASGRSYTDLKRLFAGVEKDMAFVCHDGAIAVYKGSVLMKTAIEHREGFALMKEAYGLLAKPVVYGGYMAYILAGQKSFGESVRHALNNHVMETDCLDSVNDDYLKIALYKAGADAAGLDALEKKYKVDKIYSSDEWREYVAPGVNKGAAIEYLQKRFLITREETLCFGDNSNDIEMLKQAGVAYAMENALPCVKEVCGYVTKDVAATVERILAL